MKKTIIFLLFLMPALMPAQTVVLLDTTYQTNANGKFYEVRQVEYSDGSGSIVTSLIGDTTTVFESYFQQFVNEGYRMAADAQAVRQFDKNISGIVARSAEVLTATGRDILDTMTVRYAQALLVQGWTVTVDTAQVAVDFVINNNGQLRYTVTGFPTRNATIISNTLRLSNFAATGKRMDLYKAPGGNWFAVDDAVKLKFPGNVGN